MHELERLRKTIEYLDLRHVQDDILTERQGEELLELRETIKSLRSIIWPGAILEHHYGGSTNKPHHILMVGDLVENCTEDYCPQWWALYKKAGKVL